jgi:hypothetical protein
MDYGKLTACRSRLWSALCQNWDGSIQAVPIEAAEGDEVGDQHHAGCEELKFANPKLLLSPTIPTRRLTPVDILFRRPTFAIPEDQ